MILKAYLKAYFHVKAKFYFIINIYFSLLSQISLCYLTSRQKPCTLDDKITSCVPTFGYKHVLDFTSDKEEFQVYVLVFWYSSPELMK